MNEWFHKNGTTKHRWPAATNKKKRGENDEAQEEADDHPKRRKTKTKITKQKKTKKNVGWRGRVAIYYINGGLFFTVPAAEEEAAAAAEEEEEEEMPLVAFFILVSGVFGGSLTTPDVIFTHSGIGGIVFSLLLASLSLSLFLSISPLFLLFSCLWLLALFIRSQFGFFCLESDVDVDCH